MAIIALHRGLSMSYTLIDKYCTNLEIPTSVEAIRDTIEGMRHAFEHIDDRAEGKVGMHQKEDPEALTIFNQPEFRTASILNYKGRSLDFSKDV